MEQMLVGNPAQFAVHEGPESLAGGFVSSAGGLQEQCEFVLGGSHGHTPGSRSLHRSYTLN